MGLVNKVLQKGANAIGNKAGNVVSDLASEGIEKGSKELTKKAGKELTKKAASGIGKNALIGGAVGSVTGAGIGGLAGVATGADEDNMKSMVLMGALAGGAGGAIVGGAGKMVRNKTATGSMFSQELLDLAGDMSKNGGKNLPAGGGAKGFFNKISASTQDFVDKGVNAIDDIGEGISKKITGRAGAKAEASWTQDMLDRGYGLADLLDDGTVMGDAMNKSRGKAVTEAVEGITRKANTIGGAAQGAIMGSASGALIGGIAGGIDEDESFIGGALKGGFIGGTLGGIGGGASGYFNNNARLLSNTTANVNSLFK